MKWSQIDHGQTKVKKKTYLVILKYTSKLTDQKKTWNEHLQNV